MRGRDHVGHNMDLVWFGASVFTVKAALNDARVSIRDISASSMPFVRAMTFTLVLLVLFPVLSTGLGT